MNRSLIRLPVIISGLLGLAAVAFAQDLATAPTPRLPRIRIDTARQIFVTETGQPFVPLGLSYYRPGTGWAPQVWRQFDAKATREDFRRMQELGLNCVRVFLTLGSFYSEPGVLVEDGLKKFDQFLTLAEEHGIYVHPTGPDHWEGTPAWARGDQYAGESQLEARATFWKLFAARYRGRSVLFAYDLLNEPAVSWTSPAMRRRWSAWLKAHYADPAQAAAAWGLTDPGMSWDTAPAPEPKDSANRRHLLDYQHFREALADDWVQRQVTAIKSTDPEALVTVGYIQWSVPALLPGLQNYSAFRPSRQAKLLDFLEIHFYPLERGFYEYHWPDDEARNLAYLESAVRECSRLNKPVVLAEFGWYGGGQLTIDNGRHPAASEESQARWGRNVVSVTAGLATGWLNWGFHDHPEARDVSQLTGLVTVDGKVKAWGKSFQELAFRYRREGVAPRRPGSRPELDWDACLVSLQAGQAFREQYWREFTQEFPTFQFPEVLNKR